mmetsp:Transcript_44674/g.123927  ORF Transcript_44674/g.123927 Transcript_44674/m.123927 type:complete len:245 (+) Transcript_44674:116-850(+)
MRGRWRLCGPKAPPRSTRPRSTCRRRHQPPRTARAQWRLRRWSRCRTPTWGRCASSWWRPRAAWRRCGTRAGPTRPSAPACGRRASTAAPLPTTRSASASATSGRPPSKSRRRSRRSCWSSRTSRSTACSAASCCRAPATSASRGPSSTGRSGHARVPATRHSTSGSRCRRPTSLPRWASSAPSRPSRRRSRRCAACRPLGSRRRTRARSTAYGTIRASAGGPAACGPWAACCRGWRGTSHPRR